MKTSIFVLSSLLISAGCTVSSLLASSVTGDWLLGAVVTAFIAMFTAVVVPYVSATRKAAAESAASAKKEAQEAKSEAKAAKAEADEAKRESLELLIWKQTNEPLITSLINARLIAVVTVSKGENGLEIVAANEAASNMFGRPTQELVGSDASELVAPKDRVSHQDKMAAFFAGTEPRVAINKGHAIDAKGEEFIVDVTVERLKFRGQPALMAEIKRTT